MSRHTDKINNAMRRIKSDSIGRDETKTIRLAANAKLTAHGDGQMVVRLHRTDIAMIDTHGDVYARHGGFITSTTRTWIASALEALTDTPANASIAKGNFEAWFGNYGNPIDIGEGWTFMSGPAKVAQSQMS